MNVVNFTQPNIFPIPKLSKFKGPLAFEMCGDEQTTLISGDKRAISAEIAEILTNCAAPNGGFSPVWVGCAKGGGKGEF